MSGFFTAIVDAVSAFLGVVDPFCGPVGVFTLFASDTLLACGAAGWGDEIAFGVLVTASLAIATLPVGLLLGFFIALAKQSDEPALRRSANIYTTIFRGLPEFLTLTIVYYGLQILVQNFMAAIGFDGQIEISAFFAGMVALGAVFSAYCSEVLQSAFKAIPRGQYEAGYALGLHHGRTMQLIVLPQLIRVALPGLGNNWMVLLKETSLISVITLQDIMFIATRANVVTKEPFLFFGSAMLLYFFFSLVSAWGIEKLEQRTNRGQAAFGGATR